MDGQAEKAFVVVGGLLRQGDAVLLVRQQKRNDPELKWALPGGYVERGESLLDALRREVREETGLNVLEVGPVLYVVHLIVPTAKTAFVVFVFRVDAWGGELQVSKPPAGAEERILDAQFVSVEEAIQRLEQGFRFANEPAIGFLSGDSPPGAAWVYQGDPAKGDCLIERIRFEGQVTVQ